jgi:LysR family hydrogen peroxide-inducible transcriptional activator
MEMHQIRYFLAVADELNFTRAADKCNVTQPSLTRAIKLLEEELGGPLFHRERSNTHHSELGQMVRPHLKQIYEESHQARRLAREFTGLKKTTLKLGVMCTVAPVHLVGLISALQSRHQGVELQLVDDSGPVLQEKLVNGELEVAIYCLAEREHEERLHYMPLFREQFMIVVHPEHPLAAQTAIRVQDLTGHRYLNRANCELLLAGPIFSTYGGFCERVYSSERDDWILAMVAAGMGFGFMPEHCIAHPGVVARPLIEPEFWREVNLVTVRGRPHSPAVGALAREAMRTKWMGRPAIAVERAGEADASAREKEPQLAAR